MATCRKTVLYVAHQPPEYSTTDLYLAAYLVCRGLPIQAVRQLEQNRLSFVFESSAADVAATWFTAQVSAIQYTSSIRTVKQLLAMHGPKPEFGGAA